MAIPKLDTCCNLCSLKTGTLILMYLSLISGCYTPFSRTNLPESKSANASLAVLISVGIVQIVVGACGLYGVYAVRNCFLIPALVWNALQIILMLFVSLFLLVKFGMIGGALFVLVFALLPAYCWLVIYNHYCEIEEGRTSLSPA